jgi:hypothetical protein
MVNLEEGKEYSFFVEKILSLPDGNYFVLEDEWNRKYLLPQKYYTNYPIKVGKNIICYVNKINCNGKIFLEPQHPIYKINETDYFTLTKLEQRIKHKTKEPYYVVLAENEKTKKAAVINYTKTEISKLPYIQLCKIIKFKKGEILLEAI